MCPTASSGPTASASSGSHADLEIGAHEFYVNFDPDSDSVNEAMSNFIYLQVRP